MNLRPAAGACLIAVTLMGVVGGGCSAPVEAPPELPVGTDEGFRAPRLAGSLPTGETFVLGASPAAVTVLIFYRSAHCGLCRLQLDQARRNLAAYDRLGVRLAGITLDAPEVSAQLLEQMDLGFPVVSVDQEVFDAWGVMHPEHQTAMPATFIIDRDGVIRFHHLGRNAADRTSDAGLLTFLQRLADD